MHLKDTYTDPRGNVFRVRWEQHSQTDLPRRGLTSWTVRKQRAVHTEEI